MNYEIVREKSWFKRNWQWFIPLVAVCALGIILISSLASAGNAGDYATAMSDEKLYQNAIDKANENTEVKTILGKLEDVNNMAIIESTVEYSNNKQSVDLTVRVRGDKGKAKMDVKADKKGNEWNYSLIKLRIKDPKQEIVVLQ
jgi:hypothetical protein